jgi:hypothetical protein
MALGFFGSGKVDHPMADPKRARELVAELPVADAFRTVSDVTEWLDSINRTEGFRLDRRFENIAMLDGAAKNPQRRLAQDYLAMARPQKFQENRLWTAAFGFWQHLGDAYLRCVQEHEANINGASSIRRHMPVIVARALRALALQIKWVLLRYGVPEARIWRDIARLYRLAERKGWAEGEIEIYPGAHGAGTVKRELLKALMLSASSMDGLSPVRQEIAERTIAHFSGSFALSVRPDGATHGFDLEKPAAPSRLPKGVVPAESLRFFGAGGALAGVEALMKQIAERGVPPEVNLGGSYDRNIVTGVLKHLSLQWSDRPPVRGSERRKTASSITVVPGLDDIIGVLDPSASDELDFSREQPAQSADSWIVVDASEGGFGAIVPGQKSDWIRVGTLVGVQTEVSPQWGVGLIRRITRDAHQQRQVGIQLLTRTALPVKVAPSAAAAAREPQPAILLSTSPDRQGEVGVLLREGFYNGRDSLEMTVRDKSYLLMPGSMLEGGEGFDWARFKVMQRSA